MNHYCLATLRLKRCRIVPASTAGTSSIDIGVILIRFQNGPLCTRTVSSSCLGRKAGGPTDSFVIRLCWVKLSKFLRPCRQIRRLADQNTPGKVLKCFLEVLKTNINTCGSIYGMNLQGSTSGFTAEVAVRLASSRCPSSGSGNMHLSVFVQMCFS